MNKHDKLTRSNEKTAATPQQ